MAQSSYESLLDELNPPKKPWYQGLDTDMIVDVSLAPEDDATVQEDGDVFVTIKDSYNDEFLKRIGSAVEITKEHTDNER